MASGEKPAIISNTPSFDDVLDEACDRLIDQQVRYSIRRIDEMGNLLTGMEKELDEFLSHKTGK